MSDGLLRQTEDRSRLRLRGFLLFFSSLGWLVLQVLQAHHWSQELERMQTISPAYAGMLFEQKSSLYESIVTWVAIPSLPVGLVLLCADLKEWWRKRENDGIGQTN
jgi:hypothetical protein